jgi:nucleoside-diphosphate-sugar epimerase
MKKIIVTGAKGGTGTSIVQVLQERGYEPVRIDLHPWTNDDGLGYIQLDLRDAAGVNDVFAGADGVIHFGSTPGDAWFSTTEAYHQVATAGFNVFQAAKNVGIKRIAWASSIETYGDFKSHLALPVTEASPLAPPGIYGTSKILLERLAQDYCRWHGMSIAGFRLSRIIYDNAYGRTKLQQFVADEGMGNDCLWSYVDARDVATACIAWLESDYQGAEVFNLAAANVHQEINTVDLLKKHGYENFSVPPLDAPDETLFSTAKIRTLLGWKEQYDWRDILSV